LSAGGGSGARAAALAVAQGLAEEIQDAQRPVRILSAIAWGAEVRERFFAAGARELPRVSYAPRFDTRAVAEQFDALARRARAALEGEPGLGIMVAETCESYAMAARMLGAVGTRGFYHRSIELYGRPASVATGGRATNLDLAQHFDAVIQRYAGFEVPPEPELLSAEEAAALLERHLGAFFREGPAAQVAVRCEVVEGLAAKAASGSGGVRLRAGARFSRRELLQLEHHEGHVHVATTLNGRAHKALPLLASSSPRSTRTQEGLAIFTEFLSQTIDVARLRQLSGRILAIKMAEDGADFLQLYRYFLEQGATESGAFESARRVVRGGLVEGGAPFTKDVVYLDGLTRIAGFLQVAMTRRHPELVAGLFLGKLELDDVPLLSRLCQEGVLVPPRYLPGWARDLGFLTAYMSWNAFLDPAAAEGARQHFASVLQRAGD